MEIVKSAHLAILINLLRLVLNHVELIKFCKELSVHANLVLATTQKELALIVVHFQAASLLMDFVLLAHSDKSY